FMGFSPSVLVTTAIVVAACFLNCRAKATARARGLPVAANRAGTVRTGEDQRISKDGSVVRSTTQFSILAAQCVSESLRRAASRKQRAQGKPGARCTRSLARKQKSARA